MTDGWFECNSDLPPRSHSSHFYAYDQMLYSCPRLPNGRDPKGNPSCTDLA